MIECVPNFSEGRRPEVIAAIRDAIAAVKDVVILDVSSDPSHNRTVVTFVAPVATAVDAAFAGVAKAAELIDLNTHEGEHPRLGATDVCPFIPLEGASMEDCIVLARTLGERVGAELKIPVFLYERAATRPDRVNLADIRRGEFEKAKTEIGTNPARTPDYGPNAIHPTAGATVIGARPFLVAFNVYLGGREHLGIAKAVAKAVRGSSGGLKGVKGLGLEVDGQAQVSMNLVDLDATPLHRAYEMVKMEAEALGVTPTWSEIVGLVPERALFETAARHLRWRTYTPDLILERQVRSAAAGGASISAFTAAVASSTPVPGGGTVVALVGSLAAALAQMVAALTAGRKKYAAVDAEMKELGLRASHLVRRLAELKDEDAAAYTSVSDAYKLPKDSPEQLTARNTAIQAGLMKAAEVPLETARWCGEVAELAAICAEKGNTNAVSDAGVAALLAEAACRGAAYNVRINVVGMPDKAQGAPLAEEAARLVASCATFAMRATTAVEAQL
jgi:glutamate formiminotransferase/formiminotetrahydrofolate cyclodeaminase